MCPVRSHGWPDPFRQRPWVEIDAFLEGMADRDPNFAHMSDIVKSVLACDRTAELAACTSMHDLVVVPTPVPDPPYGVVIVRAPSSLQRPPFRHVVIEHLSTTGYNDRIERPVDEAVSLFWRFMIEKFGVSSGV
jgi:hypothetical protein